VCDGVSFRSYDPVLEDGERPVTLGYGQFLRRPEGIGYWDPGSGLVGVQRVAKPAGVVGSHTEGIDKPFQGLGADDFALQCAVHAVFKSLLIKPVVGLGEDAGRPSGVGWAVRFRAG